jgi:hypothetical protein
VGSKICDQLTDTKKRNSEMLGKVNFSTSYSHLISNNFLEDFRRLENQLTSVVNVCLEDVSETPSNLGDSSA